MSKKAQVVSLDSLQNVLSGMGIAGLDKSQAARFTDLTLDYAELEAAYSTDWLSGKVCDIPPFDATRAWRTFQGSMEANEWQEYHLAEKNFKLREKVHEALTLSRIYGGAGLVINVDDGLDPWEPLNLNGVKKDSLRWIVVGDSQHLKAANFDHDPFSRNHGYPSHYSLAPSSIRIHHSRVVRFEGVALPLAARKRNQYWGKSIIERLHSALSNASSIQSNIGNIVYEASVDVLKVPDLMEKVSDKESEAALKKRFGIAKLQKSINRMLLLDIEEEYESHQQTFSGLKDMMQSYLNIVAGAADIPITRLLGQSPGGLSSTGESDIRNYYDFISGQQECTLRPKLEVVDEILYRSTFGKPPEKEKLMFTFNSLWQTSETEKAVITASNATRDSIYLDRGVITEEIAAEQLMVDNVYTGVNLEHLKSMRINVDDE